MMEMMFSSLEQQNKLGIMVDDDDDDNDSILSSEVSSVASSDDESDDVSEEVNSSSDTFRSSGMAESSSLTTVGSALSDMSELLQQLPFKRGLSKHFQGKSQSFTSLSNVSCLEDLAKPEHPYNKKLKSCRSYVGLSRQALPSPPPTRSASSSKLFTKKSSARVGASCSSLSVRRNGSFLGLSSSSSSSSSSSRPPTHPPHRNGGSTASSFSNQTPLFV